MLSLEELRRIKKEWSRHWSEGEDANQYWAIRQDTLALIDALETSQEVCFMAADGNFNQAECIRKAKAAILPKTKEADNANG